MGIPSFGVLVPRQGATQKWQKAIGLQPLVKEYGVPGILLGLCIACPVFLAFLFGVPGIICAKFILYAFVYHGVSGFLIVSLFQQTIPESLKFPAILIAGICYNILIFFVLSLFNLQQYSFLNIFVLFLVTGLPNFNLIKFESQSLKSHTKSLLTWFILGFAVFLGTVTFILRGDTIESHLSIQAAFMSSIISSPYPYSLFWYPEAPLYYNYGYHIETAFSHLLTSIPVDILHVRIYPLYILFLLILSTFSFCKVHFQGKHITGALAILGSFCVIGYNGWSTKLFFNTLPMGITIVGSAAVGLAIFLILMDRLDNFLKSKYFSYLDCAFILFLFSLGFMSRSALAPIVIGGVSFLIATEFLRTFKISSVIKLSVLNFLMGLIFLALLVIVYGVFSSHPATGATKFVLQNTYHLLSVIPAWLFSFSPALEQHPYLVHALAALITIFFISGYLFVGFYYQVFQWVRNGIKQLDLLLLYCGLTGVVIWNFTIPGANSYTFYHYSILIGGLFGANGMYLLFKDALKRKTKILLVLVFMSIMTLCAKGYEIYYELRDVRWSLLSFNVAPPYEGLPQAITSLIESMPEKKRKNTVILSLLPFNCNLNTKLNNIPVYHKKFLEVALYSWRVISSSSERKRVSDIITTLTEANILLDDKSINTFKVLFPDKNILIFALVTQKVASNHLTLLRQGAPLNDVLSNGVEWQVFEIK